AAEPAGQPQAPGGLLTLDLAIHPAGEAGWHGGDRLIADRLADPLVGGQVGPAGGALPQVCPDRRFLLGRQLTVQVVRQAPAVAGHSGSPPSAVYCSRSSSRARNSRDFAAWRLIPSTSPISSQDNPCSSRKTSAWRCRGGSRSRAARSSSLDSRCTTSCSGSSRATWRGWKTELKASHGSQRINLRRRSRSRQRLVAIRYSQGPGRSSRCRDGSARKARMNVSCATSAASSESPSMREAQ